MQKIEIILLTEIIKHMEVKQRDEERFRNYEPSNGERRWRCDWSAAGKRSGKVERPRRRCRPTTTRLEGREKGGPNKWENCLKWLLQSAAPMFLRVTKCRILDVWQPGTSCINHTFYFLIFSLSFVMLVFLSIKFFFFKERLCHFWQLLKIKNWVPSH